ncbi:MAG: YbaL family putative K(+) efflux transporter [Gemmatimonadaceae bacterium]
MPHEVALVATLAAGLALAFLFGFAAIRLGLPALVGYLIAGIVVGPFTPGYIADTGLASQLAEVGVILLMFGVGMRFSIRDLLAVRRIAVPGALTRSAVITALGAVVGHAWGWTWGGSVVFGVSLSIASTVVLLRAFEERDTLSTLDGHIAVGWLVVEDLATVLVLVLLPALAAPLGGVGAAGASAGGTLVMVGVTLVKVTAFVALMLYVGTRVVPWLLAAVARTGSRELFTLAVLALALGIAFGAAMLFGVSFALGAFFAGVVIAESDVSHQAAADALPLQDAFAVLFFVSVGMVFDPRVLVQHPLAVLVTVAIATAGKALVSFGLIAGFRYPLRTALTVSAGLAQMGEFSFILAGLGITLGLLPREGQNLILASAVLSITLNPLAFRAVAPVENWLRRRPTLLGLIQRTRHDPLGPAVPAESVDGLRLRDHAVIVGFGRVGSTIGRALESRGIPFLVVEHDRGWMEHLRSRGVPVLFGDAARRAVLEHAHLERARLLVIAAPGAYQARSILDVARQLNPAIDTVVRTHSAAEQLLLERQGVGAAVMGERELAFGMARYALRRWDADPSDIEALLQTLRAQPTPDANAPV